MKEVPFKKGKDGRKFRRDKRGIVDMITPSGIHVTFGPSASKKIVSIDGKEV